MKNRLDVSMNPDANTNDESTWKPTIGRLRFKCEDLYTRCIFIDVVPF